MSRTGVEEKLPWRRVPKSVRQQVEEALGAPVVRAARIWGGYSPTPTFRLALADGRRAFFKATYAESNEFSTQALDTEERVYRELGPMLAQWMPTHYARFNHADWHVMVLEDLGPKSAPPWTPLLARRVCHALGDFHRATLGADLPAWLPRRHTWLDGESWSQTLEEIEGQAPFAERTGDKQTDDMGSQVLAWLHAVSPVVGELMARPVLAQEPYSLLHADLRSDNLRFKQGRLYLFDWPAICVGRAEWDFVVFAQSVTVDGGVLPEQLLAWYGETFTVDDAVVETSLAWWLSFFARRAWRSEIPGLPRLRRFQQQQVAVLAQWAARRWALPAPTWAEAYLK
jgi:hypothetical protein